MALNCLIILKNRSTRLLGIEREVAIAFDLAPRHIDIDKVSDEEIQDIVLTANLTPRKCLGFKTPFQAILKELGKDIQDPVLIDPLHLAPESTVWPMLRQ